MAATLALGMIGLVLIVVAVAVTVFPDRTRRAYELYTTVSTYVWGAIFLLAAWVLLMTGSMSLMLAGALILLMIVLRLYFDGPLGEAI